MNSVFIYALKDPRNGAVRYLGKAKDPCVRLRAHLRSKRGTHKAHWIDQLKALGLRPELEVIDEVPESQWEFFERAYIKIYRESGFDLTNIAEGGDGGSLFAGHKHSPESKQKIGEKCKGKGLGVPKSQEHRTKLSEALKGVPFTSERLAARAGLFAGEKNPNFGKHLSEKQKRQIGDAQRGVKNSPEHVAATAAGNRGQKRSPEQRARMSAGMRGVKKGRPWTAIQWASFEKRKAEKNVVQ